MKLKVDFDTSDLEEKALDILKVPHVAFLVGLLIVGVVVIVYICVGMRPH